MDQNELRFDEAVDLLPPLNLHKSPGKLVLERPDLGKSCLRFYRTSFAESAKNARDIFCQGLCWLLSTFVLREPVW